MEIIFHFSVATYFRYISNHSFYKVLYNLTGTISVVLPFGKVRRNPQKLPITSNSSQQQFLISMYLRSDFQQTFSLFVSSNCKAVK